MYYVSRIFVHAKLLNIQLNCLFDFLLWKEILASFPVIMDLWVNEKMKHGDPSRARKTKFKSKNIIGLIESIYERKWNVRQMAYTQKAQTHGPDIFIQVEHL
jgi:hypothetical protein